MVASFATEPGFAAPSHRPDDDAVSRTTRTAADGLGWRSPGNGTIRSVHEARQLIFGERLDSVALVSGLPQHLDHAREQCRWFGGMVGNHVADLVGRYGSGGDAGGGGAVPQALTDYIKGREGYDYNEHGRAGNTHTSFVSDEIVDRFCIIGPPDAQLARLAELRALGVHQFAVYLQHDDMDATLAAYGNHVIPEVRAVEAMRART